MQKEIHPWYKRGWAVAGLVLSLVVLVGLGLFLVQTFYYYKQLKSGKVISDFMPMGGKMTISTIQEQKSSTGNKALKILTEGKGNDPHLGASSSSYVLVEFVDYQCPYCKVNFSVIKDILRLYPEVKIIFRDFPITELHDNAENAAQAARCVWQQGDRAFSRFQELLFANQDHLDELSLADYAQQAGVNVSFFKSCYGRKDFNSAVNQSILDGESAGVRATPTFFINGKKFEGVYTADELIKALGL